MITILAAAAVAAGVAFLLVSTPEDRAGPDPSRAAAGEDAPFIRPLRPPAPDPAAPQAPGEEDSEASILARCIAAGAEEHLSALRRTVLNLRRLTAGDGSGTQAEVHSLSLLLEKMEAWKRRVLVFARPAKPRKTSLDVNRAVAVCLAALSGPGGTGGTISFDPDPNVTHATLDLEMLHQLLVSLVESARLAAGPNGRIDIRTQAMGDQVLLAVRDDGPWMTRAELSTLFDPGSGTHRGAAGLAPALSRKIVTALGGTIGAVNVHPRGVEVGARLPIDGGRAALPSQN